MNKLNQKGFTLVELLLVILVLGILATVGITQFVNFGKDAREASVKSNLQILRNAIASQNGMMRNRCGITSSAWPLLGALRLNDITAVDTADANAGASTVAYCTAAQIGNVMDQKFVAVGLPSNPWAAPADILAGGLPAGIDDGFGTVVGSDCGNVGGSLKAGTSRGAGAYGWCYNEGTGEIWANSTCNDGANPCAATGTENTY